MLNVILYGFHMSQTGITNGKISLNVQIAYNAWIAAQTHARGMGVAMKNNNEAAAFHVEDYDAVVNEECWVNGNCENYVGTSGVCAQRGTSVLLCESSFRP